jgi:hypothetical protein
MGSETTSWGQAGLFSATAVLVSELLHFVIMEKRKIAGNSLINGAAAVTY